MWHEVAPFAMIADEEVAVGQARPSSGVTCDAKERECNRRPVLSLCALHPAHRCRTRQISAVPKTANSGATGQCARGEKIADYSQHAHASVYILYSNGIATNQREVIEALVFTRSLAAATNASHELAGGLLILIRRSVSTAHAGNAWRSCD